MKRGNMGKRYVAIYLCGFLVSVSIFVVLFFAAKFYIIDFYHLDLPPEKKGFLEAEYWENVLLKYKDDMAEIEKFYYSIEDWNFSSVEFSAEKYGKEIEYFFYDEYLNQSFMMDAKYPLNKFLRLSIKSHDFPKDGCDITLLGNYRKKYNTISNSQIIIIKLYYHDKEEITTKFIYSPNKAVHLNESNSKLYELKYLGDGWYFLKQLPDPDVVTDY